MKIENIKVYGFQPALYHMRNPMSSWEKSDSYFFAYQDLENKQSYTSTRYLNHTGEIFTWEEIPHDTRADHNEEYWSRDPNRYIDAPELPIIGPKDLELMCKLTKAGPEHAKFLRMIQVWWNITIPRYIWQELDTYKIATTRMSCSTRPSELKKTAFVKEDFEGQEVPQTTINQLNALANNYRTTKKKELLRRLKRLLPESYLQMAGYQFNYQTALNIYHQRKSHWLTGWKTICKAIEDLPYMNHLIEAK